MFVFETKRAIIQFNEMYLNHTNASGGGGDGDGADFDQGTQESFMQYNYMHDNDGAGMLHWTNANSIPWFNNTIRYNVMQNNGLNQTTPGLMGEITVGHAAAQSPAAGKREYQARCVGCHGAAGSNAAHTPSAGGRDQVYTPVH